MAEAEAPSNLFRNFERIHGELGISHAKLAIIAERNFV